MRVKTFRGSSTAAVFADIKAEFGDNAIILSNKSVEEDGRKIHEIMVGVDGQEEAVQAQETRDEVIDAAMNNIPDWNQEWNQIKGHMMALLKPQMNLNLLAPASASHWNTLSGKALKTRSSLIFFNSFAATSPKPSCPNWKR